MCDPVGDIRAERGAVLEAVPRTAADEPDVIDGGVAVNQEVAAGSVLVLADARFDDRGIKQSRHATGKMLPRGGQPLRRNYALAGVGVERGAVGVDRDLEAAAL